MAKKKRLPTKGCGHFNLDECCMECAETLHEWNARLQDSGFFDMELKSPPNTVSPLDGDQVSVSAQAKLEYHSKLYEKTNAEEFENKTHEHILRKRAEGAKIVDIVRELDSKGKPIHRETVRFIIRRFENKWLIRSWTIKQMHLKDRTGS